MVKKPVVGSDLPEPPDNERLHPPLLIHSLGDGYWSVSLCYNKSEITQSDLVPLMTEAGDGLCFHELSQLLTEGTITVCDTCGVDA